MPPVARRALSDGRQRVPRRKSLVSSSRTRLTWYSNSSMRLSQCFHNTLSQRSATVRWLSQEAATRRVVDDAEVRQERDPPVVDGVGAEVLDEFSGVVSRIAAAGELLSPRRGRSIHPEPVEQVGVAPRKDLRCWLGQPAASPRSCQLPSSDRMSAVSSSPSYSSSWPDLVDPFQVVRGRVGARRVGKWPEWDLAELTENRDNGTQCGGGLGELGHGLAGPWSYQPREVWIGCRATAAPGQR